MANAENKEKTKNVSPWVPVSKNCANLFPVDRSFTKMEALVSLQLDHNNGKLVTVMGLAKRWGWSRDRVRYFLQKVGVEIIYQENARKIKKQKGLLSPTKKSTLNRHKSTHINFIDFNDLQGRKNITTPIKTPTTHEKREKRKKHIGDPRVKIFQKWWEEKYKLMFDRDYMVTNWAKFGSQVKALLRLALSFEDLQYLAIEFLFDEDKFISGSNKERGAGHNIGMLLTRIGQNIYFHYLDPTFRECHRKHIINEDGTPKYDEELSGS